MTNQTVYTATLMAVVLGMTPIGMSDTVELRNKESITGKFIGGNAESIRVETSAGVKTIPTCDVASVTFDTPAPATAEPAPRSVPPTTAPAAAIAPAPAGTLLTIRVDTQVSSNDPAGTKFSGKLIADLTSGSTVIAKAGTTVMGQVAKSDQAGRLAGKSKLALTLTGIESGGKIHPVATTSFSEAASGTFKKTARNAVVGGVIGNAIDNDGGGGTGAAVGVGVSLIRKGDSVTVPPGAILEFRLTQPFQIVP